MSDWAFLLHYGLHGLKTRIHTDDLAASLRVTEEIGEAALELQHHADIHLHRAQVDVRLTSGYGARGPGGA